MVISGDVFDEAYEKAVQLAEEHGYTFIHPFEDYEVICGQGTIALEALAELPEADEILVPIGGGGLAAGLWRFPPAKDDLFCCKRHEF